MIEKIIAGMSRPGFGNLPATLIHTSAITYTPTRTCTAIMQIERITATVEHIKPARAADAYAGGESLTFLRCHVTTGDGMTGTGVTGRFLADQVAHLLNGGINATAKGMDPLDIEAVTAPSRHPRSWSNAEWCTARPNWGP